MHRLIAKNVLHQSKAVWGVSIKAWNRGRYGLIPQQESSGDFTIDFPMKSCS